jgi:DNA-binding YbaB/EbfC family protein
MSDEPLDLDAVLQQAMSLHQQLEAAQEQARAQVVEGSAGGGAVRVRVSGGGDPLSVHLDPSVVDPAEVDLLEDLVLAALRDALAGAARLQSEAMGGVGDLGGLGRLLGGA